MSIHSNQTVEELQRIKKPEFIVELGSVDISEIKQKIGTLSELVWDNENARKENKFKCFHHTRHIIFRFIEGNRDPRIFYSNLIWTIWEPFFIPIFQEVNSHYGFVRPVFPKVMLARLEAGQVIDSHVDGSGSNLYTHKIHVPIFSNQDVDFLVKDRRFYLEPGKIYEVNNIENHGVINNSDSDRIHLIFEIFEGDK